MQASGLSELWVKSGLVWGLGGMCFGMYLGMTEQFGISSAHAHVGLLGGLWGMALSYLFSRVAADTKFTAGFIQWLLYNLGVLSQVCGLWFVMHGQMAFVPLIVVGGLVIIVTLLWVTLSLWPKLRAMPTA